jgi:uncharacterized membrane protein
MDEQRKQILLKEIKFWKESRMLPEHYCNYLLTIYSEGSDIQTEKANSKSNVSILAIICALFLPISVYVLYFTELSLNLQIFILGLILAFTTVFMIRLTKKQIIWRHLSYCVFAFLCLEISIELFSRVFKLSTMGFGVILLLNCICWILIGLVKKLNYFVISGIACTIIFITYVFIST